MARRTPRTLIDSSGREYPANILDPAIVKRDTHSVFRYKKMKHIETVPAGATRLNERISTEKGRMESDIDCYLSALAAQYDESWKGNAELISFDGRFKIDVRKRERITFGVELQIAKQKIDECLKAWSKDSNINLRAIILEAFQVDKKGELAKHRILSLRKYNIKDDNWSAAMELIDKAIQVTSTKQYIACYQRDSVDQPFKLVPLNFSSI
ncbi:MAG: DUF3164 family protein [Candidatus Cloacimonetes bacterium]|nr:DUF3164 family protein [Candidatus Cloacimonadota bacterium]